jgi:hypothetical protein
MTSLLQRGRTRRNFMHRGERRQVPTAAVSNRSNAARYSMTSSARPSSGNGTVMPSALAVLRLRIISTFVD